MTIRDSHCFSLDRRRNRRWPSLRFGYVETPPAGRARCSVINLSPDGVLIEWQSSSKLPLAHVTLILVGRVGGVTRVTRRRACVVRRSGRRLGLRFLDAEIAA